jgi:hypothetical protein
MLNKKLRFLIAFAAIAMLLVMTGCDESTTEPGNYTVSINMDVPVDEGEGSLDGSQAAAYLFEGDIDETPLYTETAIVANDEVSFAIADVAEGDYVVLVVVDCYDGESAYGPIGQGDIFWGALDVAVENDLTINLTEDYWQRYHSILFAVRGIPDGHNGQVIASAITEDGADWWDIQTTMLMGTYTLIYNNSALLAYSPDGDLTDEEWLAYALETDSYDVLFLLDNDGNYDDYDVENYDPFSEGDLIDFYDYSYNSQNSATKFASINATFEPLEYADIALTVNYTIPAEEIEYLMGDTLRVGIWTSTVNDDPLYEVSEVVSAATGSIILENIHHAGTYLVAVTIGNEEESEDKFMAWAGLDVDISDDLTITIEEQWWQWVGYNTIGVRNMPSGHNGEIAIFLLFANDGDYTDFHDWDNFIMGGVGFVYNDGAVVSLHSSREDDESWELPSGDYDLVAFIDPDGDYEYYYDLNLDSVEMFMPYDVGDPYWITDYSYDSTANEDDFQILDGTFSEMLGITGTVTCSPWTSGGGDIYILTFDHDPFDTSLANNDPFSWDIITEPGDYALPMFPQYTGYVVAVWDANGNGLEGESEGEGGPDEGDYVGGYGSAMDALDEVQVLTTDVADIDFAIDIPYNDSLQH